MPADETIRQDDRDLDAQIAECSRIVAANPNDARAYRQRGLSKARKGQFDEAIEDLSRSISLTPGDAHAYGLRALAWARKGDREQALRDFDAAIALAPQNSGVYRSHRDRMLSEPSSGPIAGGSFNLLDNSFVLLSLPLGASPAEVKHAFEDAIEDDLEDPEALRRAQQALLDAPAAHRG